MVELFCHCYVYQPIRKIFHWLNMKSYKSGRKGVALWSKSACHLAVSSFCKYFYIFDKDSNKGYQSHLWLASMIQELCSMRAQTSSFIICYSSVQMLKEIYLLYKNVFSFSCRMYIGVLEWKNACNPQVYPTPLSNR